MDEDGLGRELGVALGHADERDGAGLHEQIVEARPSGALRPFGGRPAARSRVDLLAEVVERVGVDVDGQVEVRDGLLRLGEAAGDRLAHHRERAHLRRASSPGRRALRGGRGGDAARREALEVARDDAAVGPRAGDAVEVEAALARELADVGRRLDAPAWSPGSGRGRSGAATAQGRAAASGAGAAGACGGGSEPGRQAGAGAGSGARPPRRTAEMSSPGSPTIGDGLAELHHGAGGGEDLEQRALVEGAELHRRLVGLDLGEEVVDGDGVALLLVPRADLALLHGRGELRHLEDLRHVARPSLQRLAGRGPRRTFSRMRGGVAGSRTARASRCRASGRRAWSRAGRARRARRRRGAGCGRRSRRRRRRRASPRGRRRRGGSSARSRRSSPRRAGGASGGRRPRPRCPPSRAPWRRRARRGPCGSRRRWSRPCPRARRATPIGTSSSGSSGTSPFTP